MKVICCKCEDECADGGIITEWGESFKFCSLCMEYLSNLPITGGLVHHYLQEPKDGNWLERRIQSAKDLREKGESPWQKMKNNQS